MLTTLLRRRGRVVAAVALLILALGVASVLAFSGGADVTVYNGRSHYGDAKAFANFEKQQDLKVELRGGTAPELFERLRSEGSDTPADLLVTTDLANLWRAEEAGLLEPVTTPALQREVPEQLRDAKGAWWGLSVRVRTPVRSTERVPENAITSYADLGDERFKGKLCLRTSNNEYNQSLVADRIAKHGEAATEKLLRSWMANEPQILGSDVDVLDAIKAGRCDVGLTNHYYLARELEEDSSFPVAPAWPDQDGAGAHANLSGVGLVKGSEHRANAIKLMEYLTSPEAQREIAANGEFAANAEVPPAKHIADWQDVKLDPIDVEEAGKHLPDAVALMQRVGWR